MKRSLIISLAMASMPAFAQDMPMVIEQQKCWLGSLSFSPGATAKAGNAVLECSAEFQWIETNQWAAGCYHEGNLYSTGSIQNASTSQQALTRCEADGTWSIFQPDSQ
ncbi:hypothetical protein [Pelagibacterium sp.]|uniref:hypothetical protein n=1 Tax=Pelagibacterium sp. TaxID=1967288 RepID=UPI003A8CB725